ncbi:hypothetical protein PMIN06_012825 [Paraphaeosphaeria minitans]
MARNDKRRPKSTAVPTAADPDRDNKYRKTRRYQKRKQLRIENEPMVRRTLRNPVRQALRKQTDANYIHPWVRENPAYRYQPRKYPSASLLGLPREVRQRIMCMLYPLPRAVDNMQATWKSRGGMKGGQRYAAGLESCAV